jgi:hypothetical protein
MSAMFRRVQRAALFVGFVLALWALARPASAMPAGLCDDRGASAIAPAPSLEVPDVALMRTKATLCPLDGGPVRATVGPAHRVIAAFSGNSEQALLIGSVLLSPVAGERVELAPCANPILRGIRWRIERPPRG